MGNNLFDELDSLGFSRQTIDDKILAHEDCRKNGSHLKPEFYRNLNESKSIYKCNHCGDTYMEKSQEKQTPLAIPVSSGRSYVKFETSIVQTPIEMLFGPRR